MKAEGLTGQDLVIFGCGYLGSRLAEISLAAGLRVHGVTRNPDTARLLRAQGALVHEGWLEEDDWHGSVPASPAFAVNCVGSPDRTEEGYRRSYLGGMDSIARWARNGPPGLFIYTSSTGVYGSATGDVDEDTPLGELSPKNQILAEAEHKVAEGSISSRWFVLRLAGLYGPGRHRLLDRVRAGDPGLDREPDRRLNTIHRDDVCSAILACLRAGPELPSQVFNLTGDEAPARKEVIRWLRERTRSEPPATEALPSGSYGLDRRIPDRVVSNRRIKEALGWQPRYPDFRSGYEAILNPGKTEESRITPG